MGKRKSNQDIGYPPLKFRVIQKTPQSDRGEEVKSRTSPDLFAQDSESSGSNGSTRIPPSGQCTIGPENDDPIVSEQIDTTSSQESERIPPSGQCTMSFVDTQQEVPETVLDLLSCSPAKDSLEDNPPLVIIEVGDSPTNYNV